MDKLVEFLASCAFVYIHGTPKTVKNCELYINNVKSEIQIKGVISDAYLFDPQDACHQYRRH